MSVEESTSDERDQQLDAIIAAYYRAVEAGECIDQKDFMAKYPEVQKELSEFFADLGMFNAASPRGQHDPALEPTITAVDSHGKNQHAGEHVRYFGAYEILEELGSGGMGVVYKARHVRLKKLVALKMIRAGVFASELEVSMFKAEVRSAAKLEHAGIVAVHEVGMHAGQHFYAMDYVAGGSLSKLHRDEPVPAKRAAELVRQLSEAVHYSHGEGIVHRDLKPANILLTTKGEPRISDFGLAKRMWIGEDSVAVNMTETGKILGTPGYMSPEQAEGKTNLVAAPTDIYALGAVLYALLTSRAPFVGESHVQIIQQVTRNEPVAPRMLNPNVPQDLETICLKCLSKEPHDRYGTAQLLADDLQRFLEGRPVLARPISRPARAWRWCRRNPVTAALATALLLTLTLSSVVSTAFGIVAGNERDAAVAAKENESTARKQAQKDRDDANAARKFAQEKEHEALESLYVSRLYALEPLWQQNEWGELDRLMTEWRPKQGEFDFRGWEWHYLQDQLRQQVDRLPGRVYHAVWSPDGKHLAAAGDNLVLYDAATLTEIKSLGTCGGHFVTWSNDSTHLALLSNDVTHIFHVATEKLVRTIQSTGTAASWSPDHNRLAIVGHYNTATSNLKIWSVTGALERSIELGSGLHTWSVDWHPEDDRVLVSHGSHFSIWEATSGKRLVQEWSLGDPAWSAEWHPEGNEFFVGGGWANHIWRMENDKVTHRQWVTNRGHSYHAVAGTWSPDGRLLASGGNDFALFFYQTNTLRCCGEQHLHSTQITRVSWHIDGRLVACDGDGTATISHPIIGDDQSDSGSLIPAPREVRASDPRTVLPASKGAIHTQWSNHGDRVAVFEVDGAVRVWSAKTHELLTTLSTGTPSSVEVTGMCSWSPDDHKIAVADTTGTLRVYSSNGTSPQLQRTGFSKCRNMPYWSDDSEYLVFFRADGQVVSLDVRTGIEIETLSAIRKSATRITASGPHYAHVPPGLPPRSMEIIDALTTAKHSVAIEEGYRDVAWHPNGRTIAVSTGKGIILISVASGRRIGVVQGGLSPFCSLAWSPDGRRLAAGTTSGQIDIMDAQSYLRLLTLKPEKSTNSPNRRGTYTEKQLASWILSLDWSPDGRRLISGGRQATIWGSDAMPDLKTDSRQPFQSRILQPLVDVERLITMDVIEQKGIVEIDEQRIQDAARLPKGKIQIGSITLSSPQPLNKHLCSSLSRLEHAWRLDASGSGIDDSQLNLLRDANALSELKVSRCQLDDDSVATLGALKQLKLLEISDSLISAEGVAELRQMLSNTEIRWNARVADRAIAERLLARNAKIKVMMGQRRVDLIASSDLPEIPFRVVAIKAEEKPGLTVEDFDGLEKLDALESIDLLHTHINDAVLAKLQGLTNLQWIGFGDTRTTGEPLATFNTLHNVSVLCFGGGLTNNYVEHFDKFPGLKEAYIGWNPLDDGALNKLPSLPELAVLVCSHTQIQGSGFPSLIRFSKLRYLNCSNTLVNDEGLSKLPVLPGLTDLRLSNTFVTDASIPHLSRFTSLTHLELLETSITPEGLAEIRKAIPGCKIEWSAAPVKVPVEQSD